jgi:hypothetical protein
MADSHAMPKPLEEFVTMGRTFTMAGDIEAQANQFLKMGRVYPPHAAEIDEDDLAPGGKGGFAIMSDEGGLFGAENLAPYPLQYFLAGIAF